MNRYFIIAIILCLVFSCSKKETEQSTTIEVESKTLEPQLISLLDSTYFEPVRDSASNQRLHQNLAEAKANLDHEPTEINYIWYGRRTAYLMRYKEAIKIFTEGLERYPESYRLYRHRGHRYISLREFDKAIEDLTRASELMPYDTLEVEPDGIPNSINTPLSSTQFNVWYHLGLAYYLKGDFSNAAEAYKKCMVTSVNDDLLCATADWQYMTYRRLGQDSIAETILDQINPQMTIIENDSYHKRLMMYKGTMDPESLLLVSEDNPDPALSLATQGYGVGNFYLYNGDTTKAINTFKKIIADENWAAFGFIAAEADLQRINNRQ